MSVQVCQQFQKISIFIGLDYFAQNGLDLNVWYQHQDQTIDEPEVFNSWYDWNVKGGNLDFLDRGAVSMRYGGFLGEVISVDKLIIYVRGSFKMNDLFSIKGLPHVNGLLHLTVSRMIITNLVAKVNVKNALSYLTVIFLENSCVFALKIGKKDENLGSHLSEHMGVIKQLFPFSHSNSLEEDLLFIKVIYLQGFFQEAFNGSIARNLSNYLRRVVQFILEKGRIDFNSFWIKFNNIAPSSSKLWITFVNIF